MKVSKLVKVGEYTTTSYRPIDTPNGLIMEPVDEVHEQYAPIEEEVPDMIDIASGPAEVSYKEQLVALIRLRYSIDDELALQNNYALYCANANADTEQYKNEWDEYQAYRLQCKTQLKGLLDG